MNERKPPPTPWQRYVATLYANGWNQDLIAEICNCNPSTISRLRAGKIKKPRPDVAKRLERLAEGVTSGGRDG